MIRNRFKVSSDLLVIGLLATATVFEVVKDSPSLITKLLNLPTSTFKKLPRSTGRNFIISKNAGSGWVYKDIDNDGTLDEGIYYGMVGGRHGFNLSYPIKPVPSKIQEEYSRYLASANVGGK